MHSRLVVIIKAHYVALGLVWTLLAESLLAHLLQIPI